MNIRSCIFQFFLLGLLCTWWPLEGATAQKVLITGAPPQQLDIDASSLSAASQASDWQAFTGKTPANGGDIWFRQEISLVWNDALQAQNPLALSLQVKGLYDAYWDGALIGSNKYLGGSAPEFSRLMLPVSNLSDGNHWLYIHIQAKGLPVGENIDLGIYPTDLSSDFFGIHFTVVIVFLVAVSSYLASGYFLYVGWRGPNALTYRLAALITFATGSIIYLDRVKPLPAYAGRVICWCVTLDVLKYEVIGDRSACCTEISPCPEPSAPVSFSQDRKFHLDFAGCPPLDPLHHIAYRQLWGDRDKHMDMICRQDTTDNINIQFCTHLSGKLTDTKSDFAFEDRISVFRNPDQMVPMVKNRVLALVIVHDHSPAKMKPHPAGHSF